MSILIKGMEMPKDIPSRIVLNPNGQLFVDHGIWYTEYEAVEIPPHGRLIDADALENEAQMRLLECNKYDNQFQKPYEVMRAIALAPTIIESED